MKFYMQREADNAVLAQVTAPENLIFSGGGIKGLAYAGVIKALEEKQLTKGITRFAGASAGAITAALCAIGMNAKEIEEQMTKVDFGTFLQKSNVDIQKIAKDPSMLLHLTVGPLVLFDEVFKLGLCDGSVFMQWLTTMFKMKGFDETTTFAQLQEKTGNELYVILCYANCSKSIIASHNDPDTAHMPVVTAVRGSMAIPFVFEPLHWNDNVYVDGGTMYNYPIEVFDEESPREKTLGFILSTQDSIFHPIRKKDDGILPHLGCIYEALMNVSYEYCFRMGNQSRTIFIDSAGIGTLDFNLTPDQKKTLVDNGYNATMAYLK